MNIQGLFNRDYRVVQNGLISFDLVKITKVQGGIVQEKIIDFEIDSQDERLNNIHERLLTKLPYTKVYRFLNLPL